MNKKFVLTKKIAKSGTNSIIVIPKILQQDLRPQTVVKLTLEILRNPEVAE